MDKDKFLDKVKIALMKSKGNTFILSILFGLKIEWNTKKSGGMLSTNGVNIFINPDYFVQRDIEGAKADLLHECYHVVFDHMSRCNEAGLEHVRYNQAADFYINNMLKEAGTIIDSTFLYDRKYKKMSLRQIYDDLQNKKPPKDYTPDIIPNDSPSAEEKEEISAQIKEIISRAVVQAEMSGDLGSVPAGVKRFIDTLLSPVIDWRSQLINYFSDYAKEDYSWRKFSRRGLSLDLLLPSLYSEAFGKISIYIDTSGSITEDLFRAFLAEVQGIIDILHPSSTTIYQWGSSMPEPVEVMPDQNILEEVGLCMLGGTDIRLPIKNIQKTAPAISLIMTDGEFFSEPEEVNSDLLWVIINNLKFTAKDGEIIHLV